MFSKILIANRGDNGQQAVAARPDRRVHAAHTCEFAPVEVANV